MYAVACRDNYFGINKYNRRAALNGIVDNTVFRIEKNVPNLGTQILSIWRRKVAIDWKRKYGVEVAGFETFVIENNTRKGTVYKADNWDFVGKTSGNTKSHRHGINNKSERVGVVQKLIYCKKVRGIELPETYNSYWDCNGQCKGQLHIDQFI